ncbi:MAG: MoaD/ThiS family protein [Acidobacteriota bacterium]
MSQATVRIPTPLRPLTGGSDEVAATGQTVGEVLSELGSRHSGFLDRILDGQGKLRSFVNVYLGDANVRALEGLDSEVADGAVIHIVPAVAGGRGRGRSRSRGAVR